MNAPKSLKGKNSSPQNKLKKTEEKPPVSWSSRIDYLEIIKKSTGLFWNNKKYLITVAILLLLTGGQAITLRSSYNMDWKGNTGPASNQNKAPDQDFQKTLDDIVKQENFNAEIRDLFENKSKLYSDIALITAGSIIFLLIIFALFCLNCYFHLLFINMVNNLNLGLNKNKRLIKKTIRGKWKQLAWMRFIFILFYFASFLVFLLPAGFFMWQKSWPLAITMGGFSLMAIFIVFVMISYVFRYSLFYFTLGKMGVRESIDHGYELFSKFWKESILTSLINFALGIIATIICIFVILAAIIGLALVAAFFGLMFYLVAGMSHATGIAIAVGIIFVLIPLIVIAIILGAVWHGFIVIFWYYIFNELAGCKIKEPQEESVLAKEKKKPAPVTQTNK